MPVILVGLADFAAAALAALEAVAAFLLACAAVYMWVKLMHPIFQAVAHILPGGWRVLGQTIVPDLRSAWLSLEANIYNALITWRNDSEHAVAFTWHWMGQAWRWNAGMVEWLAKETDASLQWIEQIHLPKWAKWLAIGTLPPLLLGRLVKALLPLIHATVTKPVTYIYRSLPGRVVPLSRRAAIAAFPGLREIPWIKREVFGLTKRWARINWRLRRLEGLLTVAGFAAVLATVWGVSLRCVKRNGPIGRTARGLCGMPTHLLDDLLGLLADFYILENLCDVLPWVEAAASAVAVPFVETVTTVVPANKGCLSKRAPRYTVPQLYLPSVVGSLVEV